MSELALTLVRLGFLTLLWVFVLATVLVLRRDLRQPADARPLGRERRAPKAARPPRPAKVAKQQKVKGSRLVVIEGPLKGTIIPLENVQVTIGRAPDSTLVIDDDYASSRHSRIYPSEGSWVVEDLGSTNGTWIDRTRITSPTVLPVGAPLRIGRTTLQIQK
ncbi:MAG: FHA domain-containing protein [Actinomycetota bacterium]|nr:FHA domain-containing protein [Actinomycetota bacterium]